MPELRDPEALIMDGTQGTSKVIPFKQGMTADDLFRKLHPTAEVGSYAIAVNNREAAGDCVINHDDVVAYSPAKIEGAS